MDALLVDWTNSNRFGNISDVPRSEINIFIINFLPSDKCFDSGNLHDFDCKNLKI